MRHGAKSFAVAGLVLLAAAAAGALEPDLRPGTPLAEALTALRARGLRIVYTNRTVRPDMLVSAAPQATEPRQILDELLAPHGLMAHAGPNGFLVVVPNPESRATDEATLEGQVRSRRDGRPISRVEVHVPALGLQAPTDAQGAFTLELPGPGTFELEVRRRGYAVAHLPDVEVRAGRSTALSILLDPVPVTEEELLVTPSHVSLLKDQPAAPLALSRDDILALPHLGDDFFRALSLLPGVAANDVSAEFHVRGGRRDETQILLDGQELYDTYHLKDYDSALSVVAPDTLASVDLSTGGFPVEHGDRMSGVLDMTTVTPAGRRRTQLGVGVLNAQVGSAGTFAGERGGWLAQYRRGSIDLASRLLGRENPQFWDGFGKLSFQLSPNHSVRANVLHSSDELEFHEVNEDGEKLFSTNYKSSYLWLTQQTILAPNLFFETALSRSNVDRDRNGFEVEDEAMFDIRDDRILRVLALRQDWNLAPATRHDLKWGLGVREFKTEYRYDSVYEFASPLAAIRANDAVGAIAFAAHFEDHHDNVYFADRVRLGDAGTLELGLRWDNHSRTDEDLLSPRANLAWSLAPDTVLRAAWGRFNQSQRPYELQVQDGETRFHPVERSVNELRGIEHHFAGPAAPVLRVEVYRRTISNSLPRFENLYEPVNTFPEVEPDRVRIAPQRARSRGVELFLRGRAGERVGWWANYAYAEAADRLDGVWTRRRFDQPHTVNLDCDYRINDRWTINLAWRYHTGWPTTAVTLEPRLDDEGETEFVPVLGPRYAQRLPDYHRLDLRASRRWRVRDADLTLFFDVQNAYDRRNVAGFDIQIDDETGLLLASPEQWAPLLPSAGISVTF